MIEKATAAAFLALAVASPSPASDQSADSWYGVVADGGAWVGHGSRTTRATGMGREIVDLQELRLDNGDYPDTRISEQTVTRQDPAGRTVAIGIYRKIDRSWVRIDAEIGASEARITRRSADDTRSARVALPAGVRFDNGAGLLAGWDPASTPRLEFASLDVEAMRVDRVTIEAAPGTPPTGTARLALRKHFDGDALLSVQLLAIDGGGAVVSVSQPMFGTGVTTRAVTQAEALTPRPAYHALHNAMIKSPYRISDAALQAHIRYGFGFRDGIAFTPPDTSEQRVAFTADGVTLDICKQCGPGLSTDAAYLAAALQPTAMMQSDDPRIRAIAAPIARLQLSQAQKMEMLAKAGAPYLGRTDFNGHYSAVETLDRRAGDCTEAAVLLGALGRAAGIPTRVASGIVYSRESYHGVSNAFMPHSWVLAYVDGKWRSFDMALDVFDSTHIALSVGDGDARSMLAANQLAGLLLWRTMAEVRSAGPPAS